MSGYVRIHVPLSERFHAEMREIGTFILTIPLSWEDVTPSPSAVPHLLYIDAVCGSRAEIHTFLQTLRCIQLEE